MQSEERKETWTKWIFYRFDLIGKENGDGPLFGENLAECPTQTQGKVTHRFQKPDLHQNKEKCTPWYIMVKYKSKHKSKIRSKLSAPLSLVTDLGSVDHIHIKLS